MKINLRRIAANRKELIKRIEEHFNYFSIGSSKATIYFYNAPVIVIDLDSLSMEVNLKEISRMNIDAKERVNIARKIDIFAAI